MLGEAPTAEHAYMTSRLVRPVADQPPGRESHANQVAAPRRDMTHAPVHHIVLYIPPSVRGWAWDLSVTTQI